VSECWEISYWAYNLHLFKRQQCS